MLPYNSEIKTLNGKGILKEKYIHEGTSMRIVLHRTSDIIINPLTKGIRIAPKREDVASKRPFQFWCYPEEEIKLNVVEKVKVKKKRGRKKKSENHSNDV